jgi:hypothetical protein
MPVALQDRRAIRFRTYCAARPGDAERAAMVLAFMVLIMARLPEVALHGRVWAEEGASFMRNAIVLPWPQALIAPVGGYLNLVANAAGIVAARVVPLQQVRWVGPVTGLLFQTLPAILIVSSRFDWLQNRTSLAAALLLIATAPLAEEVWLNSLHPQFHLALCAALVLGMDTATGWIGGLRLVLILLAALCGPTAWFLLPLFAARAVMDRSWPRALQAAVLGSGVLLQAVCFYDAGQTARASLNLSAVVSAFFVKNVLVPATPYRIAAALGGSLRKLAVTGTVPVPIAAAEVAFVCLGAAWLWLTGRKALFWMFAAAVLMAFASFAASRNGSLDLLVIGAGNRYAFVPEVLFALVLLGLATASENRLNQAASGGSRLNQSTKDGRRLDQNVIGGSLLNQSVNGRRLNQRVNSGSRLKQFARGGVIWLLVIGIVEFRDDSIRRFFIHGPQWTEEVAAWRQDPNHIVRLLPDRWTLDLNTPEPGQVVR